MNAPFSRERPATTGVRRILALWFPYLSTERIRRRRLGRSWRSEGQREDRPARAPIVVSCREKNAQRVAALDEEAEGLKLKRGMGIADARAMHPGIEIVEDDPEADRKLIEALADWCDRYTPLVATEGADGLFLDITGCAHLFGGEKAMLRDVLARLFDQGFAARGGLASTPGAAWAAARFLSPSVIAPGEEASALAPLPLAALRLDPMVCAGLESVGLRVTGSIMATPRAPLARRFGKVLLMRLDQALGELEEAVSPRQPVAPLSVERHLAEPIVSVEAVEGLVLLLAGALKRDLERRGEGARSLQLALFRVDGAVRRYTVGTSRPLRDPALVQRLFREKLAVADEADAGYGFELVRLSIFESAPFEIEQTDLAGGQRGELADLAVFIDRVRARLGEDALLKPVPVGSHIPERRVALTPVSRTVRAPASPPAEIWQERPIRLLARPEPLDVIATEVPEGPPVNFRWRRTLHRVARSEGPERIATEWWRDTEDARTRDYFRVEDETGRRYWLYRQGFYGAAAEMPRWFLHGIFA
jgi:protein ImuB